MPQTEGLLDRLNAAAKPGEPWPLLVLAALESKTALETTARRARGHSEETVNLP